MERVLSISLSIVWFVLSVFLSLQNGRGTGELSRTLSRWTTKQLKRIGIQLDFEAFHSFLRVSAHFIVFFVLGILFAWSLNAMGATLIRHTLAALAVVTIISVSVEVGKIWIPGRHLQWDEAILNVVGAWCGIGIWQIVLVVVRAIR